MIKLVDGEDPSRYIRSDTPEATTATIANKKTNRFIFLEIIHSRKRNLEASSSTLILQCQVAEMGSPANGVG